MYLTIKKYNKIKDKYINKYSEKILNLRNYYADNASSINLMGFNKLNELFRNYIIELIKEITNEFKKIYKINFCVTLTGSLGRNSNNLFSDIDINYLTDENEYDLIIEVEDKINYILQEVLKYRGKDRIHSMVVYIPLIDNKKLKLYKKDNYTLMFSDGIINIPCRDNAEQLLYETYNSTRNIRDVIKYFNENDTKEKLNEWTYCFKFIYNDYFKKIYEKERIICKDVTNIEIFKNNIINNINNKSIYFDSNVKSVINAELKLAYKTEALFNFYEFLALYFRIEDNIKEFTIDCFIKNSKILNERIFECFYNYLKILQNLQYILDKKNIDLSMHLYNKLDLNEINIEYKKMTNRDNLLSDLNNEKKKLYNMCFSILKGE